MIIKFKNGIAEIIGEEYDNFNVTVEESTAGEIGLKIELPELTTKKLIKKLKQPPEEDIIKFLETGE